MMDQSVEYEFEVIPLAKAATNETTHITVSL